MGQALSLRGALSPAQPVRAFFSILFKAGFVGEVHSRPSVAAVLLCDEIVNVADILKAPAEVTQSGVGKPSWPKPLPKSKAEFISVPPDRASHQHPPSPQPIGQAPRCQ